MRPYEGDWQSTGNYFYERKKGGRNPTGKYVAWNKMVSALGDLGRHPRDTQHATARLLVGFERVQWDYGIDPETGANKCLVGMCLLAAHLCSQELPAKVCDYSFGLYLMFGEERCTSPATRDTHCGSIVHEVRKLHAKLLEGPLTIETPDGVQRGSYR